MRINKFIAQNTSLSRRTADSEVAAGRVTINGVTATPGAIVNEQDIVAINGEVVDKKQSGVVTLLLNKPVGYVCSHNGQGSPTVYELLPAEFHKLNIAGRLDKDSAGLVVMTSDGNLHQELTHPSNKKEKVYEIETRFKLSAEDIINLKIGIDIGDKRPSIFQDLTEIGQRHYRVILTEGRNRQIRRTVAATDNEVITLKRIALGEYSVDGIKKGSYSII